MRAALRYMLCAVLVLAACRKPAPSPDIVAQLGSALLTQSEVDAALENLVGKVDTASTRRQIIDQWIDRELLYQEALRLNLNKEASVAEQLKEVERSVLISALVTHLFEEAAAGLSDTELRAYYEANKDHLLTLEPYIHMLFMATAHYDTAQAVYRQIRSAAANEKVARFDSLARRHATNPAQSRSLAANYWSESRLLIEFDNLRLAVLSLPLRRTRVLSSDSVYYVVELLDRIPAGTVPEFEWVREQIHTQTTVELQKQIYDRYLQRLRVEARYSDQLVVE